MSLLAEVEEVKNKCKFCGKVFSVASNLNRHVRRVHEGPNSPVEKNVTCEECDLSFRDNHQLKVHQRTHSQEKPFSCSLCSFKAARKGDVVRHMKRCNGPKYKCNNCQKEFKSKKDVNHHHVWDPVCGTFGDEPSQKQFVKIAVSSELSVIGVNCQELIDENILEKRARSVDKDLSFTILFSYFLQESEMRDLLQLQCGDRLWEMCSVLREQDLLQEELSQCCGLLQD